jgi:hypothetical protein
MFTKERPVYEPPRAMRFANECSGAGACVSAGSGDADCDTPGSTATVGCANPGNSASTNGGSGFSSGCQGTGNAAGGICSNGSAVGTNSI